MSYLKPYTPKTAEEKRCDSLVDMIIARYKHKYKFLSTKETTAFCCIESKEIYIPEMYREYPSLVYVFDVLHEVGHLETNTLDMETYQMEYLATVWALNAASKARIYVEPMTIANYQRYICDWRDKSPNKNEIPDSAIQLPIKTLSVIKPPEGKLLVGRIVAIPPASVGEVKPGRATKREVTPAIKANMDILKYLDNVGAEYVDNRLKRGNLTIVGSEAAIGKIVDTICTTYGITGRYSSSLRAIKGRAGWWTKG